MPESLIRENLEKLEAQISLACTASGRARSDISLIAVSKGHDFSSIQEAHRLGLLDFGENYAQEFLKKLLESKALGLKLRWHFIGNIQSNKINTIAQADVVESLGCLRHAELLNKEAKKTIEVFLQVNLSPSERQGFSPEEILDILKNPWPYPKLKFSGLMTILPLEPQKPSAYWFTKMAELKEKVLKLGHNVDLSMGMSDDFAEAIAHGTRFIRVGTKIFGQRVYRSLR